MVIVLTPTFDGRIVGCETLPYIPTTILYLTSNNAHHIPDLADVANSSLLNNFAMCVSIDNLPWNVESSVGLRAVVIENRELENNAFVVRMTNFPVLLLSEAELLRLCCSRIIRVSDCCLVSCC